MSKFNDKTIDSYNSHIDEYIKYTPKDVSRTAINWLRASLKNMPKNARILEIGSGIGHDAEYIEKLGFKVDRSDGSVGFVDILRKKGHQAVVLNVLKDKIPNTYDLIIADSVLHHFTKSETKKATINIYNAMRENGRFAGALRMGIDEGWSKEKLGAVRFFSYWDIESLEVAIKSAGFKEFIVTNSQAEDTVWVHFIATKS